MPRSLAKIAPTSSGSLMGGNGAASRSLAIDPESCRLGPNELLERAQAVASGEELILSAIRTARSETTASQSDSYVINLAKKWLTKGLTAGLKQLLVLLHDAHKRGAPETALLTVAESLRAVIEGWYSDRESRCLYEVHFAETVAEGARKNPAELRLVKERSPGAAIAFLRANEEHRKQNDELVAIARRLVVDRHERKTRPAPERS